MFGPFCNHLRHTRTPHHYSTFSNHHRIPTDMDCSSEFLEKHFLRLPWPIIIDVLQFLPSELIYDPLIKVPQLRNLIIDQYYAKEVHFILSPTLRPHFCTTNTQKRELIDITSYGEIEDFLVENKDVVPQLVKVITSQDFHSMDLLLKTYADFFKSVPNLEFYIEKYELADSDMRSLLGFPNLLKLQTGRIRLRKATLAMAENFPKLANLKEIVFLGHEKPNWSQIEFPPQLKNLDMSWYSETDVTSVNLPESVVNLYWNQAGLRNQTLDRVGFPARLETLMLTNNNLEFINVSQLPQSLTTLDISNNNLSKFEWHGENPRWPPNLKSILLTNNLLDDKALKSLRKIQWPAYLENLRLDMNKFTSLQSLVGLPENLKYLDLSDSSLSSFRVSSDQQYPYFRFPESLETLNVQCCRSLKYSQDSSDLVLPEHRIRFPAKLETLNMAECNIEILSFFHFPSSLQTLSLSGNKIEHLDSYDYSMDGEDILSWTQLKNLRDLDLFYNKIESLENWKPPPAIRAIDLRRNLITSLTAANTPMFSEEHSQTLVNLHMLNLEQNNINDIDPTLTLPPNLTHLNLSSNNLSEFEFWPGIIRHANLITLDLSRNQIVKIKVENKNGDISNLRELGLARNTGTFEMSTDEFYSALEQMGLQVLRRKHNLKSLHTFK